MKTELLALLSQLGELINTLPNDPAALAPVPTGLAVTHSSVMGEGVTGVYPDNRVLVLGLSWDDTTPNTARLEVKGADGNPAGPQEWTPVDYNGSGPDSNGVRVSYVLQNPAGQVILFRIVAVNADGIASDPCEITVNADDYIPI